MKPCSRRDFQAFSLAKNKNQICTYRQTLG